MLYNIDCSAFIVDRVCLLLNITKWLNIIQSSIIDKTPTHALFIQHYISLVTLARYKHTPWGWSLKIETCRSTFKYFYVF